MRISDWSSDVCSSDLNDILRSSWCEAGVRLGRQMRLVASVQNPAPSSRVSERDPLPPEDRTPVRSDPPRTSLEALYRAQAPRLLRFFSRRTDCQEDRKSTRLNSSH